VNELISLVRIDDRLIHGQVVTQWVSRVKANRIIVVDDGVAKDPFMNTVMKSLAPSGTIVEVYSVADAIPKMIEYEKNENLRVIILTKVPQPLEQLFDGGVKIEKIVVGGMGIRAGRTKIFRNITADEAERAVFKSLLNKGVEIICQIVPDDISVDMKTAL
jgi:PTS system mannose-specific IIB component